MFITSFGEQNITYKCCSNFLIHLYQRDANVLRINENRANTSNMSPFERSQYLLKNNDTQALNAHTYEQQLKSIQQARNRGVISEQDYQQQILKQNNIPLQQKEQPLKFSIP
ncbi:hypothetical protein I9189_010655 [Acinetobacter bereziniae]|uniref:hypothetical protein n=1 Tax=Acinetobacter bereziniae TaxID=106648 RepID=UPI001D186B32|nr:hypothetical protein [Acinetobacter bereziniae]MDP6003393.1 hypothetical protein [Acinetobacter bereziniae]UUN95618.1 hypothetical protein I9189_010655 [Acinetobacter bereziniae]WMW76626.1 hypothetical protein RG306_10335 [Acinetobacter bereziniae]